VQHIQPMTICHKFAAVVICFPLHLTVRVRYSGTGSYAAIQV